MSFSSWLKTGELRPSIRNLVLRFRLSWPSRIVFVTAVCSVFIMCTLARGETVPERNRRINGEIARAVASYPDVKPELMFAIFWVESNYDPNVDNSQTTACGLAQIVKKTAQSLHLDDCHDVRQSVRAATMYMARLIEHFSDAKFSQGSEVQRDRLAVSAYHIGQPCVDSVFVGYGCRIVEKVGRDCEDAKLSKTPCVLIIKEKCQSVKWLQCLPMQTQNYEHLVYDEYRRIGQGFIDWQAAEAALTEKEHEAGRITKEIEGLKSRENATEGDDPVVLRKEGELKAVQEQVADARMQAETAKKKTMGRERQLLAQIGQLKSSYSLALSETAAPEGTYLHERDAYWSERQYVPSISGSCARWLIFVNDQYVFQYTAGDSVVLQRLSAKWQNFVSSTGRGGVVSLGFTLNRDYQPINVSADAAFPPEYERFAQEILLQHKFAPFRAEELLSPDEFTVSRCRDLSAPRAVTVVFGKLLEPASSRSSDSHWSSVTNALGPLGQLDSLTLVSERFIGQRAVEFSRSKIYIKRIGEKPSSQHFCRLERRGFEESATTVIVVKGKDVYWSNQEGTSHLYYPDAEADCASELLPIRSELDGTFDYLGDCSLPELPVDSKYDCFVNLGNFGSRFTIWAVDRATNLPVMIQVGLPRRIGRVFGDYRKAGPIALPFSSKILYSGDIYGPANEELRVVEVSSEIISDSLFDLGPVDHELGINKLNDPLFDRFSH